MISNSNSMTKQEARHSKMVPMMEKNSSALLVDVEKVSEEKSPAGKYQQSSMTAMAN